MSDTAAEGETEVIIKSLPQTVVPKRLLLTTRYTYSNPKEAQSFLVCMFHTVVQIKCKCCGLVFLYTMQ